MDAINPFRLAADHGRALGLGKCPKASRKVLNRIAIVRLGTIKDDATLTLSPNQY
jgi:hypothetical protein